MCVTLCRSLPFYIEILKQPGGFNGGLNAAIMDPGVGRRSVPRWPGELSLSICRHALPLLLIDKGWLCDVHPSGGHIYILKYYS